jgi:hypothetical protein
MWRFDLKEVIPTAQVVCQDDVILVGQSPLDSVDISLYRLKGDAGAVNLVGLTPCQDGDNLLLDGQSGCVQFASKSSPTNTFPNQGTASAAIDCLKVLIH